MRTTSLALLAAGALLAMAAPAVAQEPPTCLGDPATVPGTTGTSGDDIIIGTLGPDTIDAMSGDDRVCGEPDGATTGAADRIEGGPGSDFIQGFYGNDRVRGGDDADELFGGDFSGEFGNPDSKLDDGNDLLLGEAGDDLLAGMKGVDRLKGGAGNDAGFGGPGDDRVQGGDGDDYVAGLFGNDFLQGGPGNDFLNGDLDRGSGPEEDPNPNTDTCEGNRGEDNFDFCERQFQSRDPGDSNET